MPRPGPRPYECVRRAWHSDRHQPMRGSLIQEIFRVVNEIHSSATRKNKEWQDKLPLVVLKAEEIMYSKANSEAEYMDLKTLWDRAKDAINTIIRLDETTVTETGVFLQPCIEAALNLGCTPVRTSRSQRNNTTTYYLNIRNTNPALCPSKTTTQETPVTHYSQITKPCLSLFNPNSQVPNDKPLKNSFCLQPTQTTKTPAVYPLYYGNVKDTYGVELKENVQKTSVCEHECDLSLRIGPSKPFEESDSDNSKRCNLDFDVEARMRKRKAVGVDGFCWQPKVCSKLENAGL